MWEVECKSNRGASLSLSKDFEEISNLSAEERFLIDSFRDDIFFILSKTIAEKLGISDIHIVLCQDTKEVRNWEVIDRNGFIVSEDGFTFWSSDSLSLLPNIEDVELMVLRGNYPYLHNQMIEAYSPNSTIFYPATSLFFPNFGAKMESWISGVMDGSVGSDEISLVISKLLEEALFSRIKAPDISEFITKSQDIEMRRAVRNFSLECVKVAKNVRTRESNGNYSIVLFDEIQNFAALSKKYPKSTLLKFHKASSPIFTLDLNSERDIDILFTGTTIQKTKNFSLCYEILDNILFERPQTSIALVGVEEGVDNLQKRWSEYNVEIYGRISKEDLGKLYNRSKNHLITSGRDCFPRTIPESISCGCFNLVLDILSDGVSIFRENPGIGRVIDTSGSITILEPNYSISLEPRGDSLHRQIIEAIETSHDAYFISTLGKNLLPIDRMVQMDKVWESVDLGNISFSP